MFIFEHVFLILNLPRNYKLQCCLLNLIYFAPLQIFTESKNLFLKNGEYYPILNLPKYILHLSNLLNKSI